MSLSLELGTNPNGLMVWSTGGPVRIGDYELSMADFCYMVDYVFQNTDLAENDPRELILKRFKEAEIVKGFNPGGRRILSFG